MNGDGGGGGVGDVYSIAVPVAVVIAIGCIIIIINDRGDRSSGPTGRPAGCSLSFVVNDSVVARHGRNKTLVGSVVTAPVGLRLSGVCCRPLWVSDSLVVSFRVSFEAV